MYEDCYNAMSIVIAASQLPHCFMWH